MVTDSQQLIRTELKERPLVAIDKALESLAELPSEYKKGILQKVWKLFLISVLRSRGANTELSSWNDLYDVFFDHEQDKQKQRFFAICLLRLLSYNPDFFNRRQFRINAITLFDRTLSEDIYKTLRISIKDQTYEKLSKLEGIVNTVESDLTSYLSSFSSLPTLPNFRQGFMKKLKTPFTYSIVSPFLPRELLGARLDSIFISLEEYIKEEGPRTIQLYETAAENLSAYASDADKFGTKYSHDYLYLLASKLLTLLKDHFQNSGMSKSTELLAESIGKKYPFYAEGKEIYLSFIIRNIGSGYAFDVSVSADSSQNIAIMKSKRYLGHLQPGSMVIDFPAKIIGIEESETVTLELEWTNFNGSVSSYKSELKLEGQRSDIDWDALAHEEPYSLEPVTTEKELVGRSEILNRLFATTQSKNVGSFYIHGQKRVGKTSIVRTLENSLTSQKGRDFLVIYLDGGHYIYPEAMATIENLGKTLCSEIQLADRRFQSIDIPTFSGALTPLAQFLKSVESIAPALKMIVILDEFDDLPSELYRPGPLGDSFFLTLRSITGRPPFGFILVGGEKIDYIISCQGEKLNKFGAIGIDYLDKEKYWSDFQELVRRPVNQWLEISDDALATLYDLTSGHPYFSKLICGHLFKIMTDRRDSHVTRKEIEEANKTALRETAVNSFKHFWDDDIVSEDRELISVDRRKTMLAFAEAYRQTDAASKEEILNYAREYGTNESTIELNLKDFLKRGVLVLINDKYVPRVRFFGDWLVTNGVKEILSTLPATEPTAIQKKEQEEAAISSKDVVTLAESWGVYRGRAITEDRIRAWLSQFGSSQNQKLMFNLLNGVTFYNQDLIREKMKEAHGIVVRGLVHRIVGRKRRRDILVSYLDKVGKSGAQYAKIYADENQIFHQNVIERSKLSQSLRQAPGIQALVFADDFIGTGNSVCECFKSLYEELGDTLRNSGIHIFFIAVSGFSSGVERIEKDLNQVDFQATIHICDPLDQSAHCFHDDSSIFTNPLERGKTKEIARSFGYRLQKQRPLGYGDCQATVVFEDSCPNNTLPILWDKSQDWTPLFARL